MPYVIREIQIESLYKEPNYKGDFYCIISNAKASDFSQSITRSETEVDTVKDLFHRSNAKMFLNRTDVITDTISPRWKKDIEFTADQKNMLIIEVWEKHTILPDELITIAMCKLKSVEQKKGMYSMNLTDFPKSVKLIADISNKSKRGRPKKDASSSIGELNDFASYYKRLSGYIVRKNISIILNDEMHNMLISNSTENIKNEKELESDPDEADNEPTEEKIESELDKVLEEEIESNSIPVSNQVLEEEIEQDSISVSNQVLEEEIEPDLIPASNQVLEEEIEPDLISASNENIESNPIQTSNENIESDLIQTSNDKIESNPIQTSNKNIESDLIQTSNENIESDSIQTSNDKIESYSIQTSNENIESDSIQTSNENIESDLIQTSNENIESDPIQTSNEKIESDSIQTSNENIESDLIQTSNEKIDSDLIQISNDKIESDPISTSNENIESNLIQISNDKIESDLIYTSNENIESDLIQTSEKYIESNSNQESDEKIENNRSQTYLIESLQKSLLEFKINYERALLQNEILSKQNNELSLCIFDISNELKISNILLNDKSRKYSKTKFNNDELNNVISELQSEKTELMNQIKSLNSDNNLFNQQIESLNTNNESLIQQIQSLTQDNNSSTQQINSLISNNDSLNSEIITKTHDDHSSKQQIQLLNSEIITLTQEHDLSKQQIQSLNSDNNLLTQQINSLTTNNDSLNQQIHSSIQDNNLLAQQIKSLTSNNDLLNQQIQSLIQDNNSSMEQINSLTSNNDSLSQQIQSLTQQINSLNQQINLFDLDSLQQINSLNLLKNQIDSLNSDLAAYHQDNISLTSERNNSYYFIQKYIQENDIVLKLYHEELIKTKNDISRLVEEKQILLSRCEKFANVIHCSSSKKIILSNQQYVESSDNQNYQLLFFQNEILLSLYYRILIKYDKLMTNYFITQQKYDTLLANYSNSENKSRDIDYDFNLSQIANFDSKISRFTEDIKYYSRYASKYRSLKLLQKFHHNKITEICEDLQNENDILNVQIVSMKDKYKATRSQLDNLSLQHQTLNSNFNLITIDNRGLDSRNILLKSQIVELQTDIRNKYNLLVDYKSKYDSMKNKHDRLKSNIEILQNEYNEIKSKYVENKTYYHDHLCKLQGKIEEYELKNNIDSNLEFSLFLDAEIQREKIKYDLLLSHKNDIISHLQKQLNLDNPTSTFVKIDYVCDQCKNIDREIEKRISMMSNKIKHEYDSMLLEAKERYEIEKNYEITQLNNKIINESFHVDFVNYEEIKSIIFDFRDVILFDAIEMICNSLVNHVDTNARKNNIYDLPISSEFFLPDTNEAILDTTTSEEIIYNDSIYDDSIFLNEKKSTDINMLQIEILSVTKDIVNDRLNKIIDTEIAQEFVNVLFDNLFERMMYLKNDDQIGTKVQYKVFIENKLSNVNYCYFPKRIVEKYL